MSSVGQKSPKVTELGVVEVKRGQAGMSFGSFYHAAGAVFQMV